MKKTTFFIIVFFSLISVCCDHRSDRATNTENPEIEGPVLNNIPSGKYELFSILNAVYEANPNCFDNQVKSKEFTDMLLATLNSRAKRNPNLLTEFPTTFYTYQAHELEDGNFEVSFYYSYTYSDYPEMKEFGWIQYNIYTILDRATYSNMKDGRYLIKGKYKGLLENTKLQKNHMKISLYVNQRSTADKITAILGNFYYEDVSVEYIGDL